jgi:uncharacterized membrane protein YraQ (UPF0718 family)
VRSKNQTGWFLFKILALFIILGIMAVHIDNVKALVSSPFVRTLGNLRTLFLSLILESFPFLLLGAMVSAILEVLVSEDTLARWIPRRVLPGLLVTAGLGLLFPLCECGIVIIAGRLARKGLPLHVVTTFMLAVPLINPIVILPTRMAFPTGYMTVLRLAGALAVAVLSGYLIKITLQDQNVLTTTSAATTGCTCEHHHAGNGHKMFDILEHTSDEFFNMGSYFVVGAFLSSLLQVLTPRDLINGLGNGTFSSIAVMMLLAFGLSLCSNADAFVANALSYSFSTGSVAAFLIYGAMIDLKSVFMLFGQFKKRYIIILVLVVTSLVFAYGLLINLLGGRL